MKEIGLQYLVSAPRISVFTHKITIPRMFFILSPYVLENQSVLNFLLDGFPWPIDNIDGSVLANHKTLRLKDLTLPTSDDWFLGKNLALHHDNITTSIIIPELLFLVCLTVY